MNHKIFIYILFLVLIIFGIDIIAQDKACYHCNQKIENVSIKVEDKIFLPGHFKCANCDNPIKSSYIKVDNKYYDTECHNKLFALRCNHCKEILNGEYIIKDNNNYHKSCFDEVLALKCSLCSKIINGKYLSDFWGNKYHYYHKKENEICNYCQRFISNKLTKGAKEYDDGRVICNLCFQNTIADEYTATKYFDNVHMELGKYGIRINMKNVQLYLDDRHGLKSRAKEKYNSKTRGFAHEEYKILNGKKYDFKYTVHILNGMPKEDFEMVAAHELMHIWIYQNSDQNFSSEFLEGSCEYTSYLVAKNKYGDYWDYLKHLQDNNDDPIYGEGFKRVKKFVESTSISRWLRYIKTESDFPAGF